MKETALKILKEIGDTLAVCEAARDYEGLTEKDEQFYKTLTFCYELLAHIDFNKETLNEDSETPHPVMNDYFPKFVYKLITRSGNIDLRELLRRFMGPTQKEAAKVIGKREATISEYLKRKSAFNCDSYEKILNAYIAGKNTSRH